MAATSVTRVLLLLSTAILFAVPSPAHAEESTEVSRPTTTGMKGAASDVANFRRAVDKASTDAKKSADLFLQALAAYTLEKDLGLEMIAILLPEDDRVKKNGVVVPSPFRQNELEQLEDKPNVIRGYCGGTPEKAYQNADVAGCRATFDTSYSASRQGVNYPGKGKAKFYLANGGSSRPRPIELEQDDDGRWLVSKYNLFAAVTDPT